MAKTITATTALMMMIMRPTKALLRKAAAKIMLLRNEIVFSTHSTHRLKMIAKTRRY